MGKYLATVLAVLIAACGALTDDHDYTSAPAYYVGYGEVPGPSTATIRKERGGYTIVLERHPLIKAALIHECLHGFIDGPITKHPHPSAGPNFIGAGIFQIWDTQQPPGPFDRYILANASPRTIILLDNDPELASIAADAAEWINGHAGRVVLTLAGRGHTHHDGTWRSTW